MSVHEIEPMTSRSAETARGDGSRVDDAPVPSEPRTDAGREAKAAEAKAVEAKAAEAKAVEAKAAEAKAVEAKAAEAKAAEAKAAEAKAAEKAPEKVKAGGKGKTRKNNVRKLRMERMMSKAELARRAGVSTLTIDRVENGYPCRMDTKRKILEALELKPSDRLLVFGDEE